MTLEDLRSRNFENEFVFSASKSSGPGGQNVNKVNSKVELRFSIAASSRLSDEEKELLYKKLKNKINSDGELVLSCQRERSQQLNKSKVIEKFYKLISSSLVIQKKRKPTSPTNEAVKKRLKEKKRRSIEKKLRGNTDIINDNS